MISASLDDICKDPLSKLGLILRFHMSMNFLGGHYSAQYIDYPWQPVICSLLNK